MSVQIRQSGNRNSQVTDSVKSLLEDYLTDYDLELGDVILHHYQSGEWVAFSLGVSGRNSEYNAVYHALINDYWRNKPVNDDCVWIHRTWFDNRP